LENVKKLVNKFKGRMNAGVRRGELPGKYMV